VLLVSDGDKVTIGNPLVSGAKVMATSQGDGKGKKLLAIKFKAKTRHIRKMGHRQAYTRLAIERIVT
jgi:large subunit ribosomal protein L21